MDEFMISYHDSEKLRKLIVPSSLKKCEGIDNSANYHANEVGKQMMAKETDTSKRANEIIENERMTPHIIRITNN